MSKRKRRSQRKSNQAAGRPPKEGERYKSGELKRKPATPNEVVLKQRRAMLNAPTDAGAGTLGAAENPLDLMLARGWLSEEEHRVAVEYGKLYRRAGFVGSAAGVANLERTAKGFDASEGDARAMAIVRKVWKETAKIGPHISETLTEICVNLSWPQWVVYRLSGKDVPAWWDRKRQWLLIGLSVVRVLISKPDKAKPSSSGDVPLHFNRAS